MRHAAVTLISARTLFGIVLVLVCGVFAEEDGSGFDAAAKHEELDVPKRSTWATGNPSMMHSWGKRTWQSLQGGWGKRDPWSATNVYPLFLSDKRAWQNLQGGWGKRFEEEDAAKLAALLDEEELQQTDDGQGGDAGDVDVDKRGWRSLNNAGWGKRSAQWNNFRGSWGKRDPQWTNLKGIWGKRSLQDGNTQ